MQRVLHVLTLFCFVSGLAVVSTSAATSGIEGRAAWRGAVAAGVTIYAYREIADIATDKTVAASAPTASDGTYRLELAPGSYYLTARDYVGKPQPGKFFCYYSGGPVTVRPGNFVKIGFNLIRVPAELPDEAGPSGIKGEISYQGRPLERAYLYVYKDGKDGFKGPGYVIQPVEKGTFRLRLPPGEYYLLARKRAKGGQFGPIETGDHFNYYYANPLRIEAGKVRDIKLETITRLSLFDAEDVDFRGIRGVVRGPDGKPVKGVHVFAYRQPTMTGTPAYFSAATAADGVFALALPENGPFYLLAREAFGGPAEDGEFYGKYGNDQGRGITLSNTKPVRELNLHVDKIRRP